MVVTAVAVILGVAGALAGPASGAAPGAVAVSPPAFSIGIVIPTLTSPPATSPTPATTVTSIATPTTTTNPAAGTGPAGNLSHTGASVGWQVAGGLVLLLIGTLSVLATRRRRGAGRPPRR